MKRLDRHILAGFFSAWIASTVFFVGMYLVIHFFNKIGDLDQASAAFRRRDLTALQGFLRYYGLNIPFILVETAPFTVLMGAMWSVQQMARRGELRSTVVSGVSLRRLILPLVVTGFVIALVYAGVKERTLPALASERAEMERLFAGKEYLKVDDLPLVSDGAGNLFNITEYDVSRDIARGVDFIPQGKSIAQSCWFEALRWEIAEPRGQGWYPVPGSAVRGQASLPLATDLVPRDLHIEARGLLFLPVDDLKRLIARNPNRNDLRVLLHAHYAYPLTTLILLLIGLPLVVRVGRASAFVAAGASLLLSLGFYSVQNVLQDLGARGELISPALGVWLPFILFGAMALILFETMPS